MYAPIKPILSVYQNNRDHRKIVVIDGKVAFTGGVNLSDEYINIASRFGHWKDTAVMLTGDAVNSFTMMFLQMWDINNGISEEYDRYLKKDVAQTGAQGFVIPYADTPFDGENVGEHVYMDILNQASGYVHIMTPYLILDNEMKETLKYAAKRGVDVKIIMPHVPDKKYAFYLARSYYYDLIRAGVKIYEYTPGFVHAKVFVSDDNKATVGSINLDFRSLYLHFECGAYMYGTSCIQDIEADYQKTLEDCELITLEYLRRLPAYQHIFGSILKIFAPLM
jgi:cardiolipin synthase